MEVNYWTIVPVKSCVAKTILCTFVGLNIIHMQIQDPFDIEIAGVNYSVFHDGEDTYTIFKEGEEYVQIIKDTDRSWLKLNPETGLPLFGMDEEVNLIGAEIIKING